MPDKVKKNKVVKIGTITIPKKKIDNAKVRKPVAKPVAKAKPKKKMVLKITKKSDPNNKTMQKIYDKQDREAEPFVDAGEAGAGAGEPAGGVNYTGKILIDESGHMLVGNKQYSKFIGTRKNGDLILETVNQFGDYEENQGLTAKGKKKTRIMKRTELKNLLKKPLTYNIVDKPLEHFKGDISDKRWLSWSMNPTEDLNSLSRVFSHYIKDNELGDYSNTDDKLKGPGKLYHTKNFKIKDTNGNMIYYTFYFQKYKMGVKDYVMAFDGPGRPYGIAKNREKSGQENVNRKILVYAKDTTKGWEFISPNKKGAEGYYDLENDA